LLLNFFILKTTEKSSMFVLKIHKLIMFSYAIKLKLERRKNKHTYRIIKETMCRVSASNVKSLKKTSTFCYQVFGRYDQYHKKNETVLQNLQTMVSHVDF
jgi:hypothetical protein